MSCRPRNNRVRNLPLSAVYRLIEPGPVVLLSTMRLGRANLMTMSWHMMIEFEPPQIACVVSDGNFSYKALRATRECVIAIASRMEHAPPYQPTKART